MNRRADVDGLLFVTTQDYSGWVSGMKECASPTPLIVMTIGHSTRSAKEFIHILKAHQVRRLVDVRTVPRSRHNPQFNRSELSTALHSARLHYRYMPGLGGFRRAHRDSLNTGWHNASFRGFADYMQTPEFRKMCIRDRLGRVRPTNGVR